MGTLAVVALVGRIVMMFALLMAVPLAFAVTGGDGGQMAFTAALVTTFAAGAAMSVAARRFRRELQPRDGFLLVTLTWLLLPAFAALPLLWAVPGLSVTDAYFETMSGFTTTGATVLTGLEKLPVSVNVWRCLLVFVGAWASSCWWWRSCRCWAWAVRSSSSPRPRPDEGSEAHAANRRDGARAVGGLLRDRRRLLPGLPLAGMSWTDAFMHMCSTMGLGASPPTTPASGPSTRR